jgi:hypothetical protein
LPGMPFLELFDETLDINSTENYELSVQVSPDSLAFCILDTIRNKYVLLRSFESDDNKYLSATRLEELISKDDFLVKRFKKINLVMPSGKFTLVPAQLFDPGKKDEYFLFNHVTEGDDLILSNKINDPDSYIVFSVLRPLYEVTAGRFSAVHPYHHTKPMMLHVAHRKNSVNGNYIHLHVEREFFNLTIYAGLILKFCNSFTYRNYNDILYYVLNTFKNLDIEQEETIHLSGHTENYDDLSYAFSVYVRTLKYSKPEGNFTFSYVFNDTIINRFLNLFTAVNCE